MLNRILPRQFDNTYRGRWPAIWLLMLFLLIKVFASINQMGLNPAWTSREVLQNVEAVPLAGYSASTADVALVLFAWWGAASLAPTILGLIALIRYRSMVPMIYVLAIGAKAAEQALVEASPVVEMLGAGASTPVVVIVLLFIGLVLSVTPPRRHGSIPGHAAES